MLIRVSKMAKGVALGTTLAVCAAGCASTAIPNEKIAVAKSAVQRAEQSGAPELAPMQMSTARDELAKAQQAVASKDVVPATQWADKANADAQLAEATAQQARAHKAAMQFDASMQTLRQESQRSSQSTQ